jgi:hypothetical protein
LPHAIRFVAAIVLFSVLCCSATGQQPLTQEQVRQVNKVRKKLAHYDIGTKLDVQLSNSFHQIGTLSQTGSTSFILVDPASNKSEAIDYLDVKQVQPTRKEYMNQQLGKTAKGFPKVAVLALLTVAAIAVFWVVVK